MHQCDMIIDFNFGSTGKGLLAGYLAKRNKYDTVVCSFATNAGHTYIDSERGIKMMTQQLPTGISCPTVKNVMLGPGALIHIETLRDEMLRYGDLMQGKRLMIHPQAAIVTDRHAALEFGMTKIGSTAKGVGEAMIERIKRHPHTHNTAGNTLFSQDPAESWLSDFVVSEGQYRDTMEAAECVLIEGAQGFSLSLYHGFYPYVTSRDVTPWQIAADCGLPFKWAPYVSVCGTLRTFPIRVNNRDGTSGPGYPDQDELSWDDIGVAPEKTTVTKLDRRIFTFSVDQLSQALWHCGQYWKTRLFLNFANYLSKPSMIDDLIAEIEKPRKNMWNAPHVEWVGYGPGDGDVVFRPTTSAPAPAQMDLFEGSSND